MSNFPHCKNVQISFLEKPDFDYVLKPLGGETFGMDINSIPGLASFVKDQVHAKWVPPQPRRCLLTPSQPRPDDVLAQLLQH